MSGELVINQTGDVRSRAQFRPQDCSLCLPRLQLTEWCGVIMEAVRKSAKKAAWRNP